MCVCACVRARAWGGAWLLRKALVWMLRPYHAAAYFPYSSQKQKARSVAWANQGILLPSPGWHLRGYRAHPLAAEEQAGSV